MKIRVRNRGVGSVMRMNRPVYLMDKTSQSPISREFELGRKLVESMSLIDANIESLVMVSSLPKVYKSMLGASIVKSLNLKVGGVVEISGGCGSILDALHYIFCSTDIDESVLLLVVDSFLSSYGAHSKLEKWADGGGGIFFHPDGELNIKLLAYVSTFDSSFLGMVQADGCEISIPFSPLSDPDFSGADIKAIEGVVHRAIRQAGLNIGELTGVVTVNRSAESLERLSNVFEGLPIFESRANNSHVGAADVICNIIDALDKQRAGRICIIGFGLGYSWQAMIVEIY
jgi:3-oxoacyl-[acyl-carrier-protein] synthase III